MVGGYFPTPYPNECLYSILCRFYAHSVSEGYETVSKILFGNVQALMSSIYIPTRIECVDRWAHSDSGITRKSIASNHTLYPYWAISYPPDFREETEHVLNGGAPTLVFDRKGALKSRRSWSKYLKHCPLCTIEDNDLYGETYWRRQHQLSEMFYCVKHQVRLLNSTVSVRNAGTAFHPASVEAYTDYNINAFDNLAPYKDKLLIIGRESEWLVKHGLEIDWSFNGYEKYSKMLRDKGLASFQGRCDYLALDSAFDEYWGKDYLEVLFVETDDSRFTGWTYRVDKNKMRNYKPLYYILLMCFLAGSIEGFVNSNPADTPFGHPPFLCENPICPHYSQAT